MRIGPRDGMVVRRKCVCFAFQSNGTLHVEKQVFERYDRCMLTGKDPAWIHGRTLKQACYSDLNRPVPKEIMRRYKLGSTKVKFLRCRSCTNYAQCQFTSHVRLTFKPTPAGG